MFDYLGYLKYLDVQYFKSKTKLCKELSKWFKSDTNGRTIKGNMNTLAPKTTENLTRYTAYKHKEKVKNDYNQLKLGVLP